MGSDPINYEAVLADIDAKIAQLEAAKQAIRLVAGMGPSNGAAPQPGLQTSATTISHDTFLGMSIPEATKKLLAMTRRRLSTPEVIKSLVQGGVPEPAYNTAYAVLSRRQKHVGDIININGEWGLKEWSPNYKPPVRQSTAKKTEKGEDEPVVLNEEDVLPEPTVEAETDAK
jgi:hypothetical protein